jgi:hypothetical protein
MLEGTCGPLEAILEAVVMTAEEAVDKAKPDLVIADLSLRPSGEVGIAWEPQYACLPQLIRLRACGIDTAA